jgi:hypothetical protein
MDARRSSLALSITLLAAIAVSACGSGQSEAEKAAQQANNIAAACDAKGRLAAEIEKLKPLDVNSSTGGAAVEAKLEKVRKDFAALGEKVEQLAPGTQARWLQAEKSFRADLSDAEGAAAKQGARELSDSFEQAYNDVGCP